LRVLSVIILVLVLLLGSIPVLAQPGPPPLPFNATPVASGLLNPRGFTFAPDGALIVAESGAIPPGFVPPDDPFDPYFRPVGTTSGRISRIDMSTGERTVLADGLPSSALSHGDTLGPVNVAYLGSDLYVLISAGPVHGWPNFPSGVYRLGPNGTLSPPVANLDSFNSKNPVSLVPPDDEISNPYDMMAADGALWITDGNRQQVYRVTPDGAISRLADLSDGHPVTTGMARAADGSLILSELTSVPYPEGAGRIRRVGMDGAVSTLMTGTTAATGLAMAPDGSMYVVEISKHLGQPPFLMPFSGRVARVTGSGQLETVADGLMFPTIARTGPDGALYVAHFSVGAENGEGQILRIATGR
jgi:hypothetical protein